MWIYYVERDVCIRTTQLVIDGLVCPVAGLKLEGWTGVGTLSYIASRG